MPIDTKTLFRELRLRARNLHQGLVHGSKIRLRVFLLYGEHEVLTWTRDYVIEIEEGGEPLMRDGRPAVNLKGEAIGEGYDLLPWMVFHTSNFGGMNVEVKEPLGGRREFMTCSYWGDRAKIVNDGVVEETFNGVEMAVEVME